MQVTIPVTRGREILFEGKWYPMGTPIDVDFSTAVRMRRNINAVVPYVHNAYDPSLWRDRRAATLIADIDGVSGWGNVGLNLLRHSRSSKFSLVGRVHNVRDPYVSTALSRPIEPGSAGVWHEQPKAEWLMPAFSRNVAIVPFETTLVPPSWVPRINFFDALLVPCEQNRRMMLDSGVTIPVEVIHWGVDVDKFPEIKRPEGATFTFGHMGALSIRKGTDILVRAFERAFPTEQDVRLICKTSNRQYNFMSKDKRIEVQMGEFSQQELMDQFFRRVDCFVFPTLGEGFGLTPLEAMATGIPAIVTGWSGPEEYMNDEVGWRIEHTMDEATAFSDPRSGVYKEPCGQWAIPSMDHLVHLMRHAYEHRDEARAKGAAAARYVREQWTWEAQIGLFDAALDRHL
jgi:glycosyltransferase involved in cell wall biosynthesis